VTSAGLLGAAFPDRVGDHPESFAAHAGDVHQGLVGDVVVEVVGDGFVEGLDGLGVGVAGALPPYVGRLGAGLGGFHGVEYGTAGCPCQWGLACQAELA